MPPIGPKGKILNEYYIIEIVLMTVFLVDVKLQPLFEFFQGLKT